MVKKTKSGQINGYWNVKANVLAVAKKCKTRSEFNLHQGACNGAKRNGWFEECIAHMPENPMWRGVRIIHEFLLSHDIAYTSEKRFPKLKRYPYDFYLHDFNLIIEHHGEDHRQARANGKRTTEKIQEIDLMKKKWAASHSICYIAIRSWETWKEEDIVALIVQKLNQICRIKNKKLVLKKRKLTAKELKRIESRFLWDKKENVLEEASKYKTITDFQKGSAGAYTAAWKNGWLEDCGFVRMKRQKDDWTIDEIKQLTKLCKSRQEFREKYSAARDYAQRHGWMNEVCAHIKPVVGANRKWTFELCIKEAKKYKTKTAWRQGSSGSYAAASQNGWLAECCKHMVELQKPRGYWTKKRCIEDARKYQHKVDWQKNSKSAYSIARKNGWLSACYRHMIELQKPHGYWSLARCQADAKKYKTKTEWRNNSNGYSIAKSRNWLDQCCGHMTALKQLWTFEDIVATTKGYPSYLAWIKANPRAYDALSRLKRYDEIRALFSYCGIKCVDKV